MQLYHEYQEKKYWQNRICRRKDEPEKKLVVTRVFHPLGSKHPIRFQCRELCNKANDQEGINFYVDLEFRVESRWVDAALVLEHRVQELEERTCNQAI
ncbi:hypothetical protein N5C10_02675 [Acinetobacter johnsonii]|uniref:Uncharacterized protein n=1 Tax=Acinetobacter johnsonii TaxID=40214 RepID=A0AA42MR18_ACIJO|nr:hypothetical protein [Acinetobacter johnsonii]MDH0968220.1 hypothetical protein [Acinetobacter johnsonii]